jgi:hypothetical protein
MEGERKRIAAEFRGGQMMREISRMSWEDPKMLELDALPEALGHCNDGSSASAEGAPGACISGGVPTQGTQSCHTGEQTSGSAGTGHLCNNGGVAGPLGGGCSSGTTQSV